MTISIIIPTLNEETKIGQLLNFITSHYYVDELIVVDGGSSDNTVTVASQYTQVIGTSKGRGHQLNIGAEKATAEILWFLHADTIPHPASVEMIIKTMGDSKIVGGAFEYSFQDRSSVLKIISYLSNKKNRLFNRLYGDMGIFIRREIFNKIEGYPESLLMEDFALSKIIKREGKIKILPHKINTSSRDWRKTGIVQKVLKDSLIKTAYQLNFDNEKLYNWYYGVKK